MVVIASTQSKLDIAEKCGLKTIKMSRDDYSIHEAKLKEILPLGADCIVDCTGSVELVAAFDGTAEKRRQDGAVCGGSQP